MNQNTNTNKKVLVIDTRDDKVRKAEANGLAKLCQEIRNSDITKYISRTIMAVHDVDSASICTIPPKDSRNYALIEVFSNGKTNLDMNVKLVKGFLTIHKYKTIAEKVFKNKEYPVCKLIVKFQ